jgi:DNA-directed RNA polymerase specialized sigma24 family protein
MLAEEIGDAECVKRVQRGDTQSFEILVRRHQNTTFNLIYRFLGDYDEATETAQKYSSRRTNRFSSFAATPTLPLGSIGSLLTMPAAAAKA